MAILDKNSIIQKNKEFLEKYDDVWGYGNSILYDMCENAPHHDRDDVIVAKTRIDYPIGVEPDTEEVDNVRIYAPIDLNRKAILRRLDRIIAS